MDVVHLETPAGYHLARTFAIYRMGPGDPSLQVDGSRLRLALQTPLGPTSLEARHRTDHLSISLWGEGQDWLRPHLDGLFGLLDDPTRFVPEAPAMRQLWKRSLGTHLPTLPRVFARLAQVILLQLVTTAEGCRAWRRIVGAFGTAAPGPVGLVAPPSADTLSGVAWYRFVADGVPHRQARTLVRCARSAARIEAAAEQGSAAMSELLGSLPGVGPWTVGYTQGTALGDPDAVPLGDHHLPHTAAWVLSRQQRGSDERLLELLEPYRGNRFRVIRALWASGVKAPRRGPKRAARPIPL